MPPRKKAEPVAPVVEETVLPEPTAPQVVQPKGDDMVSSLHLTAGFKGKARTPSGAVIEYH